MQLIYCMLAIWYRKTELIAIVRKTANRKRNPDHDNTEQQRMSNELRSQSELACSARIVHHIQSRIAHTRTVSETFFSLFQFNFYTCLLAGIFLFRLRRIRILYRWLVYFFAAVFCSEWTHKRRHTILH